MHELSIAQSVVELAREIALKEQADSIKSIKIEIGALSGVALDALEFALEITRKNTILDKAAVTFLNIPGKALCRNCGVQFETNDLLMFCPNCHKSNFEIIDGKQLKIKSVTI